MWVKLKALLINHTNNFFFVSKQHTARNPPPSDVASIKGYNVIISLGGLGKVSISPSAIPDEHLVRLFEEEAQDQAVAIQVCPYDFEKRIHLSAIFRLETTNLEFSIATLPDSVCNELKKAIQLETMYQPFNNSRTMEEQCFNTILSSTFLYHGKPPNFWTLPNRKNSVTIFNTIFTPHDHVQVEWDSTSWIYKQETGIYKQRPDIIFNDDGVMEIGCGEGKRAGVSECLVIDAKIRVLEIMKRQLHLRLKDAKNKRELSTFRILIVGKYTEV